MSREDALIHRLKHCCPPPTGGLGIGDDCAVIPIDDSHAWLISTDALVENTHFQLSWLTAAQLAHKSVMVNVSDIAAMGGTPCFMLLTLALPISHSTTWAEAFIDHISHVLHSLNITLIGGDTVSAEKLMINITIIGKAPWSHIKYRHGGQAGDIVCVTKSLGGAYAGLQCLLGQWHGVSGTCMAQQLTPTAQVAQGQWLAQQRAVHAMMDISDGLSLDIAKLCQASKLGVDINPSQIPIDAEAARLARDNQHIPWHIAYLGGEDYGLLCTIATEDWLQVSSEYRDYFQQELTAIGTLCDSHASIRLLGVSDTEQASLQPFQHFELGSS